MWHVLMPFDLWVKRGARDEASIVWRCRSWCHHIYPLLLLTVTTVALVKRIYANGCHNDNNTRHAAFTLAVRFPLYSPLRWCLLFT